MSVFSHIKNDKLSSLSLFAIGLVCIFLSYIFLNFNIFISPLIVAILFGILLTNLFSNRVKFLKSSAVLLVATKQILRLGIIFYGFRISFADAKYVGIHGVGLAIFIVVLVFLLGLIMAKILKIDFITSALISAGAAVCGAAAIMASATTLKADEKQIAIAVASVVIFGTVGMFIYSVGLSFLNFTQTQIGFFIGSSLHEVAHVVGASARYGDEVMKNAVIIKMLRVVMLVPLLLFLAFISASKTSKIKEFLPYFAFYFLGAILLNSLINIPIEILNIINFIADMCLCVAMFCLGLNINKSVVKNFGFKPLLLAIFLFFILMIFAYFYIKILI